MNKKILIVDDDLYVRELYEEICKKAGFDVDTAVDGEEAGEKIKSTTYDLIFLDIMMPKVDGLSFLTKMRDENLLQKNTPVVILTNLAHESVIKAALDKGAVTCLIKSDTTPDKLIETVKLFTK